MTYLMIFAAVKKNSEREEEGAHTRENACERIEWKGQELGIILS